nr:reverse transcriptase domain-containing protein [Tanacetum cinerariifolium]
MPLTYRASTSANHDPMINPAFVGANYEILESLLRERKRQIRNEDLRTELEYFSKEYDKEKEMEPRPTSARETTLILRAGNGNGQPLQSSLTFVHRGHQPSTNTGGNLPTNDDTLLILGLHEEQHIFGFVHGLKTRSLVEFLSTNHPTTYKDPMEKTYTWIKPKGNPSNREGSKTFEQPPRMIRRKLPHNMSKYYHFYKDHGHDTNQCRELRYHIKETVKSGQLYHLVGIKKGKENVLDTQLGGKPLSINHKLKEYKHIKPIKQKKRGLGPDRGEAACKEVDELTKAGILRKFKDQKSHLPKTVDKVFSDQIGQNLEAYVDDMVIKSTSEEDMLKDIQETFDRVLQEVELNYPGLEKLILALVYVARRLQSYFPAHPIRVLTDAPIKQTLTNPEKSRRIAKWAIELEEHDIEFKGRDFAKKQIPNGFLVEIPSKEDERIIASKIETKKEG